MGRKSVGRLLAAGLILAVAGCAVPPAGISKEQLALYETSVASVGCDMLTERDYNTVQFETGLTREQVLEITAYQLEAGRAEKLDSGAAVLTVGACSDPAVRNSAVIEEFRAEEPTG